MQFKDLLRTLDNQIINYSSLVKAMLLASKVLFYIFPFPDSTTVNSTDSTTLPKYNVISIFFMDWEQKEINYFNLPTGEKTPSEIFNFSVSFLLPNYLIVYYLSASE